MSCSFILKPSGIFPYFETKPPELILIIYHPVIWQEICKRESAEKNLLPRQEPMNKTLPHIPLPSIKVIDPSGPTRLWVYSLLVLLFIGGSGSNVLYAQEKNITHIYTNFNGFWSSGINKKNVEPNDSHEVLGFTYDGRTFSTGVDDSLLTREKVDYVHMTYQSLPVVEIPITSGQSRFAQFGAIQDGSLEVANGDNLPVNFPVKLADLLNDGVNGLDLGTGVTNMKGKNGEIVEMTFPFKTIIGEDEIGDGIPDILISQIAKPIESDIDQIWFEDSLGNVVGETIEINQTSLPPLGGSRSDFFDPVTGIQTNSDYINSRRDIRISAYEVSELGLSAENYTQADRLVYQLGGSSDVAFIAVNMRLFELLIANDDRSSSRGKPVEIDVLANDRIPSQDSFIPITIVEEPENGTVIVENGKVIYRPNPTYGGTDIFRYQIYSKFLDSYHSAYVRVEVVPGKVMINPAIPVRF